MPSTTPGRKVLDYRTPPPRERFWLHVSAGFVVRQLLNIGLGILCWLYAPTVLWFFAVFLTPGLAIIQLWLLTGPDWGSAIKRGMLPFPLKVVVGAILLAGPGLTFFSGLHGVIEIFFT
ncbi:MAG TPA: hypothetical protein VH370_04165 [Humisphaera sp.]|jgi:hypothetical protein|nr:hypothetical protein [Humisphaera sp.]